MKQSLPIAVIMMGSLLGTGCATKKFVKKIVDPVSGKVDQVSTKTDEQGKSLDQTKSSLDQTKANLEKDETALSATNERALSADNRAGQALTAAGDAAKSASDAGKKADTVNKNLDELKGTVANLDDYKQVGNTTVNFKFNSDKLDSESKMALDQMVSSQSRYKRFFIAVEGFTDGVGAADYNTALSRRRADTVVQYLVAQHNIPIYRIHMIGLGEQKPVEEGKSRAANAKNRRVEVTLFSADQNVASNGGAQAAQ